MHNCTCTELADFKPAKLSMKHNNHDHTDTADIKIKAADKGRNDLAAMRMSQIHDPDPGLIYS